VQKQISEIIDINEKDNMISVEDSSSSLDSQNASMTDSDHDSESKLTLADKVAKKVVIYLYIFCKYFTIFIILYCISV